MLHRHLGVLNADRCALFSSVAAPEDFTVGHASLPDAGPSALVVMVVCLRKLQGRLAEETGPDVFDGFLFLSCAA